MKGSEYRSIPHKRPPPGRAVKPEADDIARKNRGTMDKLQYEYGNMPQSARAAPRVKAEAEDIATKNKGTADKLFYNYGNMPNSSRPAPRVKSEAAENAEKGRGAVGKLLGGATPRNHFRTTTSPW